MNKKVALVILSLSLSFFSSFLLYRVIDVGVSLNYLEESFDSVLMEKRIIERFQRIKCADFKEKENDFFWVGDEIVINGVRFECRSEVEGGEKRLYYSER